MYAYADLEEFTDLKARPFSKGSKQNSSLIRAMACIAFPNTNRKQNKTKQCNVHFKLKRVIPHPLHDNLRGNIPHFPQVSKKTDTMANYSFLSRGSGTSVLSRAAPRRHTSGVAPPCTSSRRHALASPRRAPHGHTDHHFSQKKDILRRQRARGPRPEGHPRALQGGLVACPR